MTSTAEVSSSSGEPTIADRKPKRLRVWVLPLLLLAITCTIFWGYRSPNTRLFNAVRKGDVAAVKAFLDAGGDVNTKEEYSFLGSDLMPSRPGSRTLLLEAVKANQREMVELLVSRGADTNAIHDRPDWTPLNEAVSRDNTEIADILLDHGADINPDPRLLTPLSVAAREGHVRTLEFLIERGARVDPHPHNPATWAAMYEAAEEGHMEVIEALVRHGASVDVTGDHSRSTPLHGAAMGNRVKTAEFLLDNGARIDARDRWGRTPLARALSEGNAQVADLLRERGATE